MPLQSDRGVISHTIYLNSYPKLIDSFRRDFNLLQVTDTDRIPIKSLLLGFFCSALYLCLSLPEMPSSTAKGNRLTNSAQEVMVSGFLLNLLIFS